MKPTSVDDKQYRQYCYSCYRPLSNCYCQYIKPFETNVHYIILMHPKEARRQKTGTGRLTHLALKNSELIIGIDFTENPRVNKLINQQDSISTLLFPGEKAEILSPDCFLMNRLDKKRINVFLLDATWFCAQKMLKRSLNLQKLPFIAFNPDQTSRFFFKQQPQEHCLSTIEAAYYFLKACNQLKIEKTLNKENTLMDVLDRLVAFQIQNENINRSSL